MVENTFVVPKVQNTPATAQWSQEIRLVPGKLAF